jgi:tRNA A58 N-methylase Trm61
VRWSVLLIALAGCGAEASAGRPPAFDRYRRPDLLVEALALRGDERVADIGAQDGYLTLPIARKLGPHGRVVATDIDRRALDALRSRIDGDLRDRIEVRAVTPDDPGLGDLRFDLILLSEVDHLLLKPAEYLAKLRPHLAEGGRIAVANKRYDRERLLDAAARAGLVKRGEFDRLPAHFLIFFGAPR